MTETIADLELNEIIASGPPISPIPHIDSYDPTIQPISPILYNMEYATAMSYIRTMMSLKEYSPRSLALTDYIIKRNPAHYTIWTYRYDSLNHYQSPSSSPSNQSVDGTVVPDDRVTRLLEELKYIESMAETSSKNYQLWHHRELIMRQLPHFDISHEKEFLDAMIAEDAKNYHVWSYRQWLCAYAPAFRDGEELVAETLLKSDVYNNSAWNHRFFILFEAGGKQVRHERGKIVKEVGFVKEMVLRDPDNPAPWAYLSSLLVLSDHDENRGDGGNGEGGGGLRKEVIDFTRSFEHCPPALSLLFHHLIASRDLACLDESESVARELMQRDGIRKKYWTYQLSLVQRARG